MRWSTQLIPTLREVPQEAEIPSHQLMLRAGLIRRLGAGLYTYLPLGVRSLRKVAEIVREEMDRAGALEVFMPALHPQELWHRTGRLDVLGDTMFSVSDRQERALVLGPTHEEVITDLVSREISSYRQLPRNFYQIQTKFRDEIRPRFGLMRAKEFIMKDAYSFDADWEGCDASYHAMYNAYVRIFQRCGLRTKAVEADSGAMGGSGSSEFMVLADSGEDGIVECDACSYAANLERAEGLSVSAHEFDGADLAPEVVDTPKARTIEEVVDFLKLPPSQMIKTLIYVVDGKPTAVLLPGDRDVNEIKLSHHVGGADVALADDATVEQAVGAPPGFVGPLGLTIPILADSSLKGARGCATGANKRDQHMLHVDLDRDLGPVEYVDLSIAKEGDRCPRCAGTLHEMRGIEVGHVFKLGTKYSEALGAMYLDADGERNPMVMGCYGIGVSRTLQSAIEQSHDKDGIIWPISIAPYEVEVVVLNMADARSVEVGESLIHELTAAGVDVLYDDREERPGVKFKDADLVGIPVRVAIGERSLAQDEVELKVRGEEGFEKIAMDTAVATVLSKVEALRSALLPT